MKLKVTQKNIEDGEIRSKTQCALALAAKDSGVNASVDYSWIDIVDEDDDMMSYRCERSLMDWITRHDHKKHMGNPPPIVVVLDELQGKAYIEEGS